MTSNIVTIGTQGNQSEEVFIVKFGEGKRGSGYGNDEDIYEIEMMNEVLLIDGDNIRILSDRQQMPQLLD
jgi:hypothetical protein